MHSRSEAMPLKLSLLAHTIVSAGESGYPDIMEKKEAPIPLLREPQQYCQVPEARLKPRGPKVPVPFAKRPVMRLPTRHLPL